MSGIAEVVDNSGGMNSVMRIGGMHRSTEERRNSDLADEFLKLGGLGIKQAVLITRDGELVNVTPEKKYACISAAMVAASLGAAETAFAEISMGIPDMMVLCLNGEKIIVKGAGPKMLLITVIDNNVNENIVLSRIKQTAEFIKSMS